MGKIVFAALQIYANVPVRTNIRECCVLRFLEIAVPSRVFRSKGKNEYATDPKV